MSKILILRKHIAFSQRDTAPLKGDMRECTLHCFKGHGASSTGMLHILWRYFSVQTQCIAPKEDYTYQERYACCMSVLHTAFVGRYGVL